MFVEICLPIHSYQVFTYSVPEKYQSHIKSGVSVVVQFGSRQLQGHVTTIIDKPSFQGEIIEISAVADCAYNIPDNLWSSIQFASRYYLSPIGKTARAAIPINMFKSYEPEKETYVRITSEGKDAVDTLSAQAHKQRQTLLYYRELNTGQRIDIITKKIGINKSIINKLSEKQYLKIYSKHPVSDYKNESNTITLSEDQQQIFNNICISDSTSSHLIHGVPGSGKTEIYIKLVGEALDRGKGAIVLVPDISLTPQIVDRFIMIFGDFIGLWHSRLTEKERGVLWHEIQSGSKKIVIGPRSAIFAPIKDLGIIVIDEEQESSYKQEETEPRYHARDIALVRAKSARCRTILLSATPSIESIYNSKNSKLVRHVLSTKYIESEFPHTELIGIGKPNSRQILSPRLISAIDRALQANEQIIILQNRRGYSIIEKCTKCKHVSECSNCAVTLTRHKTTNKLMCHYCDYSVDLCYQCNQCGGDLEYLGHGTENIEAMVKRLFPKSRVLRMDTDTTKGKNTHKKIIDSFSSGGSDILIGTQMVAKGLDFSNVTVVGVVNADHGLHIPDFRSSEKIFHLIYQVIGRAGRRKKKGTAIIQTYNTQDSNLIAAAQMRDKDFYNRILDERKQYLYPPYVKIARVLILGKNQSTVQKHAHRIYKILANYSELIILGPSSAPIQRIRLMYRYHILIKTKSKKPFTIQNILYKSLSDTYLDQRNNNFIKVQIDIDPMSML